MQEQFRSKQPLKTSPQEPAGQVVKFGVHPGVDPQTPGEMQTSPGEQQTVEHGVPGVVVTVHVPVPSATVQVAVWQGPVVAQAGNSVVSVGQQEPAVRHKPSHSGPAQHTVGPPGTVGAHVPFGQQVPSPHSTLTWSSSQHSPWPRHTPPHSSSAQHTSAPALVTPQVSPLAQHSPSPQVAPTVPVAVQHSPVPRRQIWPHWTMGSQHTVSWLELVGRHVPSGQQLPSSHTCEVQQSGMSL